MSLKRNQVNLHKRMIYLKAGETKEGHSKRVPIHKDLVPILEQVLKISSLENDEVFLIVDKRGVRAPSDDSIRNPWDRAVKKMDFETKPRLNDLRHTWRTNARRSGVDPQIAESIMGHWFKGKSVNDRYGRISDQELVDAMDRMTVDHGDTEILTTRKENVIKV